LVKKYVEIDFDPEKAEEIEREYEKRKMDRISSSTVKIYNLDVGE
jgi:hypothetical protein